MYQVKRIKPKTLNEIHSAIGNLREHAKASDILENIKFRNW